MSLLTELKTRRDEILALAEKCGLKNVHVFGSVARGEERPDSDIDLLVTSIPGDEKGLATFGFPVELEEMLGRRVDMIFEKGLNPIVRKYVMKDAVPL